MKPGNKTKIVVHDLLMSACAWQLAWWTRFNFEFPYPGWRLALETMPLVMLAQGAVFWRYGLYRGLWRFASIPDLLNIMRAAALGALSVTLLLFIVFRLEGVPRAILVLYPILLLLGLGAPRLGYRLWKDSLVGAGGDGRRRVLIIGAGRAAELLAREMRRDGAYQPVGFLDDDARLHEHEVHGVRVLGRIADLPGISRACDPALLMIAIPSADNEQMRRIVEICELTDLPIQTLPILSELAAVSGVLREVRKISIDDLLGRDKVELDREMIRDGLSGKTILVSGGGGSIGGELCRQLRELKPRKLIIFERSEANLYRVQQEMRAAAAGDDSAADAIEFALGDVCDAGRVDAVLRRHLPDMIFHAAAYKHVPLLESQAREAIRNNIVGTQVLAEQAARHRVGKFILISSDKAVNPANVMGRTKRVAEILCELNNKRAADTGFVTVRFGNVLGSEGSVVPLFQRQIDAGGPVTVTSPEVSRYFMTVAEACRLIMQAGVMGAGGEIYVLDMGEPVKISYLAEQMIRLATVGTSRRVRMEYIGMRPGEKLHEELYHDFERREPTRHEKILLARHNTESYDDLERPLNELLATYETRPEAALPELLADLLRVDRREGDSDKIVSLPARRRG